MVSSRSQDIVSRLAANAAVLTSAATSAEMDAASDLSAAGTRATTTSNVQADGCLTDEQKVAMFGQQATSAKPTTPKQKRKAMIKAVADFRIMFQKHKAESIDVTDDNSSRPFDQSVYEAKEKGADAEYDAQLARQGLCGPLKIWVGKDYVNFIFKDFVELDNPFADMVDRTVTPRMPWHDIASCVFGKPARDVARHFIQRWNFTKLEKKKTNPGIPMLLPKSNSSVSVPRWATNSAFNCNCQILRSSCEWSAGIKHVECSILNAYIDLIHTSKHYIYIENQFFISIDNDSVVHNPIGTALYERIIQAYKNDETFRVYVIMPLLPAFEGDVGAKSGTSIQAVVHWNYASICRGGKSLLERLANKLPNPFKYVSFYGLRKHEEMCGNLTTELIYVHSKLLIVDDQSVIIASANINDRSMLGNRDSELGILVQDTCTVDSVMDGKPYKAGAFACSLRKSLFREHLGVAADDRTIDVSDPTSTEFYTNTWLKLASVNTSIYDKVFCCVPTDAVRTLHALHEYQRRPVLAQADPGEARQQLLKVRGYLVLLPLHFLCDETLTPAPGTKEALAPTVIWT